MLVFSHRFICFLSETGIYWHLTSHPTRMHSFLRHRVYSSLRRLRRGRLHYVSLHGYIVFRLSWRRRRCVNLSLGAIVIRLQFSVNNIRKVWPDRTSLSSVFGCQLLKCSMTNGPLMKVVGSSSTDSSSFLGAACCTSVRPVTGVDVTVLL